MNTLLLDPVETRVLGCLLEKERVTPENYPLSLNSLTAACNQSTNRDPIGTFEERTVEKALSSLREKRLATMIHSAGARVQKYRHNLPDQFSLSEPEIAVLAVLMLRGPQTPGELRARTERLHAFTSLDQLETCLAELSRGDDPMVRLLAPRPGQKERRYVQLLSAESGAMEAGQAIPPNVQPPSAPQPSRAEVLERKVAELESEMATLREEFATFRRQFE